MLVEMLEGKSNLCSVETSPVFTEPDLVAKVEEQLSAIQEVGDEVEALGRLESVVQLDDERVRNLLHNVALDLRVIHLVGLYDKVLL